MRKSFVEFLPIYVLTFIWLLTFSLYFWNPFHLPDIRTFTWVVLLTGISMIYIGYFSGIALSSGFSFQIKVTVPNRSDFPFPVKSLKRLLFIFSTISLIGVLGRIYIVMEEIGGIEKFILDPAFTRQFIIQVKTGEESVNLFAFKIFSYMRSFMFACIVVGGILYTIPKCKLISIYPLIVAFIAAVLDFQRGTFIGHYIHWLISAFIFVYYQPKFFQKRAFRSILRQIIYFIIIFALFSLFVLLLRFFFKNPTNLILIVNSFYFYISGNIWILDKYLVLDPQPLYGLSNFRTIVSWFSALGLADKSSVLPPHYEFYPIYNTAMNTFTFVRIIYEDFKFPGIVFISYLWGMFTFISVKAFVRRFSFVRVGIVVIMTFSFFWSFYTFNLIYITLNIVRLAQLAVLDYFIKPVTIVHTETLISSNV